MSGNVSKRLKNFKETDTSSSDDSTTYDEKLYRRKSHYDAPETKQVASFCEKSECLHTLDHEHRSCNLSGLCNSEQKGASPTLHSRSGKRRFSAEEDLYSASSFLGDQSLEQKSSSRSNGNKRMRLCSTDSHSNKQHMQSPKSRSAKYRSRSLSEHGQSIKRSSTLKTPRRSLLFPSHRETFKASGDQTPYSPLLKSRYSWKSRSLLPSYEAKFHSASFGVGYIDSHCHLDFLFKRARHSGSFKVYREMLKQYFPVSYEGCVAVFCDPATFKQKYLWKCLIEEEGIWGAFGCHPHNAASYNDDVEGALIKALNHEQVKALGEIGLDYSNRNNCDKDVQHKVFKRQLEIAIDRKMPLVIHSRDSDTDCFKIMKKIVPDDYRIHLHCFTGGWELAKMWLEGFSNLFIGITNVVTFPSATSVHEVVKKIPLERLLLETDAPYFLPRTLPRSLRWSHPGMAIHVAAQISAIRGVTLQDTLRAVRKNTGLVYGI